MASAGAGPRISVVMPCFNSSGTLIRALASVAAQQLPPSELVCVDDASSDDSLAILRDFAAAAPFPVRIEALARNGGAARARNAGIARAGGDWLAFLDSDDSWHPARLRLQWMLACRHGAELVGGHSELAPANCGGSGHSGDWPEIDDLSAHPVGLVGALWRNPFNTSTVLVRARPGLRFPEDRLAEDYALWLALLRDGCPALAHQAGLARMYKPAYGSTGLSARLWKMERGELRALAEGCRGRPWLLVPAWLHSLAKCALRAMRSAIRQRRLSPAPASAAESDPRPRSGRR